MITQIGFTREGKPYNYGEYQCDYETDVQNLPKIGVCAVSSKAYVSETSNVYVLSNQNTWLLGGNTKSGGGSVDIDVASTNEVQEFLGI